MTADGIRTDRHAIGRSCGSSCLSPPRRSTCSRGSASCPTRCCPAEIDETPRKGELPIPYAKRIAAAKAAAVAQAGRARPRGRHGRRGRPAHPPQGRDRGRGARGALACSPAAATASISAVTLIDGEGRARHRLATSHRRLQAARRGGARRLSRQRRMAGQGGRLCDPGPRRGLDPPALRLLVERRRPAPLRNARLAPRRRLPAWLSGSTRRGSARTARSSSRATRSSKPRSSCRACAPARSSRAG